MPAASPLVPEPFPAQGQGRSFAWLCASVALFALLKNLLFTLPELGRFPAHALAGAVLSLLALTVRYPDHPGVRRLVRGIAVIVVTYLLLISAGYAHEQLPAIGFPYTWRWPAIVLGIAALWRPGVLLFPLLLLLWCKQTDAGITGLAVTPTDYMPIIESGVLLWCALALRHWFGRPRQPAASAARFDSCDLLVLLTVAVHFGNYFHSGLAKLLLDGGPLVWVFENHTPNIMAAAVRTGIAPLAGNEPLWTTVYAGMSAGVVAANLLVISAQLASVIAITRVRLAFWLTLFFDFTHVVIFIVSGIFFWKWIMLNAAICWALSAMRTRVVPAAARVLLGVSVICAIGLFFTARLAWYDSRMMNDVYVAAVVADGRELRVPTNYFLNTSVTFTQSRIAMGVAGHLVGVESLGSVYDAVLRRSYETCTPVWHETRAPPRGLDRLQAFLRRHHRHVLAHSDADGRFDYDAFPHHVWSNPWLFDDFKRLDKRTIVAYKVIVESVCLGRGAAEPVQVLRRTEFPLEL